MAKKLSPEDIPRWTSFLNQAAVPLLSVAPNLRQRAAQSKTHFGIRIAPWVTADLCLTPEGVKVRVLSNNPRAIGLFEQCKVNQQEIELARGMHLPADGWSDSGEKQRSFSTPIVRSADLEIVSTREEAENQWFIDVVIRLSAVIRKLVEQFKQEDKGKIF